MLSLSRVVVAVNGLLQMLIATVQRWTGCATVLREDNSVDEAALFERLTPPERLQEKWLTFAQAYRIPDWRCRATGEGGAGSAVAALQSVVGGNMSDDGAALVEGGILRRRGGRQAGSKNLTKEQRVRSIAPPMLLLRVGQLSFESCEEYVRTWLCIRTNRQDKRRKKLRVKSELDNSDASLPLALGCRVPAQAFLHRHWHWQLSLMVRLISTSTPTSP